MSTTTLSAAQQFNDWKAKTLTQVEQIIFAMTQHGDRPDQRSIVLGKRALELGFDALVYSVEPPKNSHEKGQWR